MATAVRSPSDAVRRSIVCPFTIAIDTREQKPYAFGDIKQNTSDGGRLIDVPILRKCLSTGDYSIVGMEDRIAIERKSKEDLFGSVVRRRNFEERLERMTALRLGGGRDGQHGYAAIVVEAEMSEILSDPPRFSKLHPRSLSRTILAWRQRYAADWHFVAGRGAGEMTTFRILERFYNDAMASQGEASE